MIQLKWPICLINIFECWFKYWQSITRTRKFPLDFLRSRNASSIFLAPVILQELETIIQSLNTNEAIGPYSIPVFLLKILDKHIAQPLSVIVNYSVENEIFPDKVKVGKVNPLHKRYSSDNPSNYRRISIISVFSKLFEKLKDERLQVFGCIWNIVSTTIWLPWKTFNYSCPFIFNWINQAFCW